MKIMQTVLYWEILAVVDEADLNEEDLRKKKKLQNLTSERKEKLALYIRSRKLKGKISRIKLKEEKGK